MVETTERCPRCRARLSDLSDRHFECGSRQGLGGQSSVCRRLVKATNREAVIAVTAREYYAASQLVMEELSLRRSVSSQLTRRCADAETLMEMALTKARFFREEFGPEVSDAIDERANKNAEENE